MTSLCISDATMSKSSLLSSPSLENIWKQHRVGILFIAIVLTATVIFFVFLIILKWFEAKRRRQELQPGLRDTCMKDDVERGVLLDTGASYDETGRASSLQLKPDQCHRFVIVTRGGRWFVKLVDVIRGAILMPRRDSSRGVLVVDATGNDFTTGQQ